MLETIVSKFGTCFTIPEEVVFTQDDTSSDMYFISQGDCAVNIRDRDREVAVAVKLLAEGDHFGEIAALYKPCKRTATIVSRNYNTMAQLSRQSLNEILNEYPDYEKYLRRHVY